jgi:hypothetical protein
MVRIPSGDSRFGRAFTLPPSGVRLRPHTMSDPGGAHGYARSNSYPCSDVYSYSYSRRYFAYPGAHAFGYPRALSRCRE